MSRFTVHSTKLETFDKDSGLLTRKYIENSVVKTKHEPFFITYSNEITNLYAMPFFNTTTKVLWKFLEYTEYNTGKVHLNADRVKEILGTCKIARRSYYRAVDELKKAGIISGSKYTFTVNETMFWKGDRSVRKEIMDAVEGYCFRPVYSEDAKSIVLMEDNRHHSKKK